MLLYSAPLSLFARKVEIALGEKAIAFDRIMAPFSQTEGYSPKHPAVMAANPKAQVPVLIDGGLTLYDSTVIIEYLEDAYPTVRLFPHEPAARARCRLLELEADEVLLVPVRALMHRSEPPGPDITRRQLQEADVGQAEAQIVTNYAALSAKLAGQKFLCGEFSAADIATFMVVHYAVRLGGPPPSLRQNLQTWYARLADRSTFATAMAEIAAADRQLSHPVPPYRKSG